MWTLYARNLEDQDQKTFPLIGKEQWIIGRSSSAQISIPWDRFMSRKHLKLTVGRQNLLIEQLPEARNEVLYQGKKVSRCKLQSGDDFLVGSTLFQVVQHAQVEQESIPSQEIYYPAEELQSHHSPDSTKKLELLSMLPRLLEHSPGDENFIDIMLEQLSQGIPDAGGILLLQQMEQETERDGIKVIKHFSRLELPAPQISQRLWNRSIFQEKGAILHLWEEEDLDNVFNANEKSPPAEFTASPYYNWAFCLPVELPGGRKSGLYVYGQYGRTHSKKQKQNQLDQLQGDVKFTNLMSELTSAVVRGRQFERQQVLLRQFFPKEVSQAMNSERGCNILEPRDCELTVLFCDLSDFTTRAEQHAENLFDFLKQVSEELECATTAILRHGGVIGDFHGDAVMGFWGWPLPGEQAEERACLAALEIQREFKALQKKRGDNENKIRIGISSGRGIAGQIGTRHQMKVTAFGSVVNRAERLQGIGKQQHSAITIDQATAEKLKNKQSIIFERLKPLKRAKAKGIEKPIECYELGLE